MKGLEIAVAKTFFESMDTLGATQREAVQDALRKIHDDHASLRFHPLGGVPFKSVSVSRGALRVICHLEGSLLVLLHVGPHDAAYAWAARHRVAQVGRVVRILATEIERAAAPSPSPEPRLPGPLARHPDKVFRYFAIGPHAASWLRELPDEETLLEVAESMAPPVDEALLELAADPEDVERVVRSFEAAKAEQSAPRPLEEALRHASNAESFWIAPGERALAAALEGSLDAWRVFLHPSQRRIVERRGRGAMKITGGPGTGKTVVALHRARFCAEERFAADARPVLLTTFSRVLAEQLAAGFELLTRDAPELRDRVQVLSLTAVAQRVAKAAGGPAELLVGEALEAAWAEAMAEEKLGRSLPFYRAEREHVVVRHGAFTEDAYVVAPRADRGTRLDRAARRKVWRVLEAFEAALARRGGGDLAALSRDAAAALRDGATPAPWCCVVADEVQDAGPAELRLLAALGAGEDGKIRHDALFLAGDGHQRIYRSPIPLNQAGIEVRGNARVLRLNYRTTEGIRRAAVEVVAGQGLDALDQGDEGEADGGKEGSLEGYRSLRDGPAPELHRFPDRDAEATFIAARLAEAPGVPTLILARTKRVLAELGARLEAAGVRAVHLGEEEPAPGEGVVLSTLHRAKGLEAPRVIIAGLEEHPARFPGGDPSEAAAWKRQEESLLYVGMTRARDWCALTRVEAT